MTVYVTEGARKLFKFSIKPNLPQTYFAGVGLAGGLFMLW